MTHRWFVRAGAGALLAIATMSSAWAMPPIKVDPDNGLLPIAGGCGPGRWRGPWGHCRGTPYYGPLPGGGWRGRPAWNGCPPGYWRGPWGHCRNTPYHGRLPGGGWR
jgi:hypothetical protein